MGQRRKRRLGKRTVVNLLTVEDKPAPLGRPPKRAAECPRFEKGSRWRPRCSGRRSETTQQARRTGHSKTGVLSHSLVLRRGLFPMARAVNSRRARLDVTKHIDEMMDRLCARHSIIDSGDWKAFPIEGLCWLRVKCLEEDDDKMVLWPAWLLARGTETWQGPAKDRDDWTRVVCCYGSGWTVEVQIFELMPYGDEEAAEWLNAERRGGRLYRSALAEASARVALASNETELSNFHALVSQNLDLCQAPLLLGRVWRAHELRVGRQPKPSEILAVRWNDDDWWPATVDRVGAAVAGWKGEVPPDAIEVVYDDENSTRETIIRGSAVWKADVRCLGDSEQPLHDEKDVELLDRTEFMLESDACQEEEEGIDDADRAEKQKPILIDATEEEDHDSVEVDQDDEAYVPGEKVDDDGGDVIVEEIVADITHNPIHSVKKRSYPADDHQPSRKEKRSRRKSPTLAKRPRTMTSTEHRRRLLQAAASRWSVSSRLVNDGGVALAVQRIPGQISTQPSAPKNSGGAADSAVAVSDTQHINAGVEEVPRPKKKTSMRAERSPAAPPSVLSLLLEGEDTEKKAPSSNAQTPSVPKKMDSAAAAAVAAVELSLASSKKFEARILTMTAPSNAPAASPEGQAPAPAPICVAQPAPSAIANAPASSAATPSPAPPASTAKSNGTKKITTSAATIPAATIPAKKELKAPISTSAPAAATAVPKPVPASSRLPPGWVAKWSERKQMYYYAHKAKRLTRWTPPRAGDEAGTDSQRPTSRNVRSTRPEPSISSTQGIVESTEEPRYVPSTYPQPATCALDAAKRTMAALEASISNQSRHIGTVPVAGDPWYPDSRQSVGFNAHQPQPYVHDPLLSQQPASAGVYHPPFASSSHSHVNTFHPAWQPQSDVPTHPVENTYGYDPTASHTAGDMNVSPSAVAIWQQRPSPYPTLVRQSFRQQRQ